MSNDSALSFTAAIESLRSSAVLAKSERRSSILAHVSGLKTAGLERLRKQGVEAILFGRASVLRPQRIKTRTEFSGGQIRVTHWPEATRHTGTPVYAKDRVRAVGSQAIVVFVSDLSVVGLKSGGILIAYGKTYRPARRRTQSATLQTGQLRTRLAELDGG